MIIIPYNDVLFDLFPGSGQDEESRLNAVREYYTLHGVVPTVTVENAGGGDSYGSRLM